MADLLMKKAIEPALPTRGFSSSMFVIPNKSGFIVQYGGQAHPTGRLPEINRFDGCLPPHSSSSSIAPISLFSLGRPNVSISDSSIRPLSRLVVIHPSHQTDSLLGSTERHPTISIPRRFSDHGQIGDGSDSTCILSHESPSFPGMTKEPEEISSPAFTDLGTS
ncbi:hypothetical protein VTP01DRAFT_4752 [Rhizomucor pusillus]|uniref:uncharacterized protein n=1 Tax=Rhizomucor pusillus TaxID=4840 RepID=UPI0037429F99